MNILLACNNAVLGVILKIARALLSLVQIVGPILLIISLGYLFVKLAQHPDDKKLPKRIFNSFLALIVVFFVPTLVIAVLNMTDEGSEFGACWRNGGNGVVGSSSYIDPNGNDNNRVNIIGDSNYEKGTPGASNNGSSSSSSSNGTESSTSSSNTSSSSGSGNSTTTTATGTGVIGMHINSKNKIVYNLYNQSSSEWKGHTYSSGQTIAQNGCMNTSVAVVSSAYNKSITPVTVFNKYRHSHPRTAIQGLTDGAIKCESGSTKSDNIISALNAGNVVVIKVYGRNKGGSSPFTSSQHYMALIDIDSSNIFVGNAYSNSTHGKAGWFSTSKVLTSVQSADYCYPSSSLKGN